MSLTQAVDLLLKLLTRNPELFKSLIHEAVVEQEGKSTPHWRTQGKESMMYHDLVVLLTRWRTKLSRDDDPTEPRVPPVSKDYETPDEE